MDLCCPGTAHVCPDWTGGLPRQWAFPSASIPSGPVSWASPIQSAGLRRRRDGGRWNAGPAGPAGGFDAELGDYRGQSPRPPLKGKEIGDL